jgi:putative lipoic acid-binding regulatory protein
MSDSETLQTFPTEYTFKVFGRQSDTFVERVRTIVAATFGPVAAEAVSERASSGGKYLSVTIVQWVERREQLEEVYTALKAEPEVLLYI